jgi:hypothetical protein
MYVVLWCFTEPGTIHGHTLDSCIICADHNLQFIGVGSASYWFDHVDESTVFGGFTQDVFPGSPWPGNAAQHCDSAAACHNDSNPQATYEVIRGTDGTYVRALCLPACAHCPVFS